MNNIDITSHFKMLPSLNWSVANLQNEKDRHSSGLPLSLKLNGIMKSLRKIGLVIGGTIILLIYIVTLKIDNL